METTVQNGPPEREPEGLTPEQIEMDRQANALDDGDDRFVIGQTPTAPADPGRIHLDLGGADELAACGYYLGRDGGEGWTTDPAKVTCPGCRTEPGWTTTPAGYVVPADLDDDPRLWTGEPIEHPMDWYFTFGHGQTHPVTGEHLLGAYVVIHGTATAAREQMVAAFGTAWCDKYSSADGAGVERFALRRIELPAAPVEPQPERRTVGPEVMTDELRQLGTRQRPDAREEMAAAKVGLVLRIGGRPVAVPDTDVPWAVNTPGEPVKALRGLLSEAISGKNRLEREEGVPVDLLMPTPDVLAALDGRPDAQLLTAPVHVLALDVTPGMLLAPDGDPWQQLVTATRSCTDPGCEVGASCVVLTVNTGDEHRSGYARTRVRIPAAVTQ
jgi:hypothetical protein